MYNNAIDHSEGSTVWNRLTVSDYSIEFMIRDDGIGIFEKIKNAFGLDDHRQVLAALAKGGLTTDPARHSGQGIFFTSQAFDSFWIMSQYAAMTNNTYDDRWMLADESADKLIGTVVIMAIAQV